MLRPLQVVKKVCMLGPRGAGKTALLLRATADRFDEAYRPTTTAQVYRLQVDVVPATGGSQGIEAILLLWDLMGELGLPVIQQSYYTGAEGAVVVADAADGRSFQAAKMWVADFRRCVGRCPVVVVANKLDLVLGGPTSAATAAPPWPAQVLDQPVQAASARTGMGVAEAFRGIAAAVVNRNPF